VELLSARGGDNGYSGTAAALRPAQEEASSPASSSAPLSRRLSELAARALTAIPSLTVPAIACTPAVVLDASVDGSASTESTFEERVAPRCAAAHQFRAIPVATSIAARRVDHEHSEVPISAADYAPGAVPGREASCELPWSRASTASGSTWDLEETITPMQDGGIPFLE